jgi:hypothetical protein
MSLSTWLESELVDVNALGRLGCCGRPIASRRTGCRSAPWSPAWARSARCGARQCRRSCRACADDVEVDGRRIDLLLHRSASAREQRPPSSEDPT